MDKNDRKEWLKDAETSYRYHMAALNMAATVFYFEAKRCYVAGAYFATCAMVGVAVEGFLRSATKAAPFAYLDPMIREAKRKKVISPKLAKRLRNMKDTIRNLVMHEPEEVLWGALGFPNWKNGKGADEKRKWDGAPAVWW